MRLKLLLICLFACNLCFGQNEEIRKEIDKIIDFDTDIGLDETPGYIIAIIDNDSSYIFEYGTAEINREATLNAQSLFETGSLSKAVTASLITALKHHGMLDGEANINSLLAEEYRNPTLDQLSINSLLNHTSGLPKLPKFFGKNQESAQNPYANYTKEQLLEYYKTYKPIKSSRKRKKQRKTVKAEYSHLNYALLEVALEQKFGLSFDALCDKYLFQPLQMSHSCFNSCEEPLTVGYDRTLKQVNPWTYASFSASEGFKSNLEDLIIFMQHQLQIRDQVYDFSNNHNKEVQSTYGKSLHVGKAWHIVANQGKFNIINHSGKTTGHQCFFSFIKETKTGVIILSNSGNGTKDLGFSILRMINHNWKRKS